MGRLGLQLCEEDGFSQISNALKSPAPRVERLRDLFPLPLLERDFICERGLGGCDSLQHVREYLDGVVVGLNWMHGVRVIDITCGRPSTAQLEAHSVLIDAAISLHARMVDSIGERSNRGWESFEDAGHAPPLELIADVVAVPTCAGTCDPRDLIGPPIADWIKDARTIFPDHVGGLDRFSGFYSGARSEYIKLTVRQLRAGLLRLGTSCAGGGTVFPVGKSDGKSQRVVWHGTRVSLAASKPPVPRHLADPAVFATLDLGPDECLRVSKRDCRTWFDQLVVDPSIGQYFGRPSVLRSELIAAGVSDEELILFGAIGCSNSFVPCSQVWPMGFSWSSCVAQETLLSICSRSNMGSDRVLANDAPLPIDLSLAFAVATDDLMVFSSDGPGSTTSAVKGVEHTMDTHGIVRAPEKDIDDALFATCVGVDLVDGTNWWTPGGRLWKLLDAIVDLAGCRHGSPGAVAGFYGAAGWYDLLRRSSLSVFHDVYDFASGLKAKDWTRVAVPCGVIQELLLDRVFALFTTVDMRLPYLSFVGATDASTVYGHGAAVANLSSDEIRQISRLSCKGGAHVQLGDGPELSEALLSRLGPRHDLQLTLKDFSVVLCVKVDTPGHINLEEANALVGYVRWILRSRQRFRHKVVVLIDSKVVIGAVAKGRSSSVPLNRILRRLTALCFAGGLVLRCIFVPTSHNPGL